MSFDPGAVVQILWPIALVSGIILGLLQLRQLREQRRVQMLALELPEGLSRHDLETHVGERFVYLYLLMGRARAASFNTTGLPSSIVRMRASGPRPLVTCSRPTRRVSLG